MSTIIIRTDDMRGVFLINKNNVFPNFPGTGNI